MAGTFVGRAGPRYSSDVKQRLDNCWKRKEFEEFQKLLQEYPYVLDQGTMACMRAVYCELIKDYQAAAVFFADAVKRSPDDATLVFYSGVSPLFVASSGQLLEAWNYAEYLIQAMPHALTFITTSILRFRQAANAVTVEEQRTFFREQIQYFNEAWRLYPELPAPVRNHQDPKSYMALCLEYATWAQERWGNAAEALRICNLAIAFAPQSPGPRTMRGTLTYPSSQAMEDFQEAIRLGEENYFPFYALAHASLVAGNYAGAMNRTRQALERRPTPKIEAQLCLWLAIALQHLESNREEVLSLLRRGQKLDPANEEIRHNIGILASVNDGPSPTFSEEWRGLRVQADWDEFTDRHESWIVERRGKTNPVRREFASTLS